MLVVVSLWVQGLLLVVLHSNLHRAELVPDEGGRAVYSVHGRIEKIAVSVQTVTEPRIPPSPASLSFEIGLRR